MDICAPTAAAVYDGLVPFVFIRMLHIRHVARTRCNSCVSLAPPVGRDGCDGANSLRHWARQFGRWRRAQQGPKIPRIGILAPGPSEGPDASRVTLNSLVAGLRELGYSEGRNIVIERLFGESNADRLREQAAELVKRQVDVIVALSTTAARPARQTTTVIPIVAIAMADPVEDDLVAGLARPGGSVTGTTFLGPELVTKRLQLRSEVVPQHSRVAILWHPRAYGDRTMAGMLKEAERAAQTLGIQLQLVPATSPEDITGGFSLMTRERAHALSVFPSPMLFAEYGRIAGIAAENRLPTIYAAREGVEVGGLPICPIWPGRQPSMLIRFSRVLTGAITSTTAD
jgi:putative tryptophan/tyrosine transport system substrate-binding protein